MIWAGFAALLFAAVMAAVVVALPPAPVWPNQKVYEIAFGNTWRIALASMFAYFCGEFVNSFVLAKMKVVDRRPLPGTRASWAPRSSGEAVDSALFYPLAFYNSGIMPNELVLTLVLSQFVAKTAGRGRVPRRSPTASSPSSSAPSKRTITTATRTSTRSSSRREPGPRRAEGRLNQSIARFPEWRRFGNDIATALPARAMDSGGATR